MSADKILQIIPAPAGLNIYRQSKAGNPWHKMRLVVFALVDEGGSQFIVGMVTGSGSNALINPDKLYPDAEITLAWTDEEHIFTDGVCNCTGGCACSGNCKKL